MNSRRNAPMLCSACGTENRAGSRFCDNCGTPLASACPSCGESNRADARFCASCGHQLRTDAPAVAQQPSQVATASAERRLVSVLFADLVGFTSLAEDRDPEAVRELLSRYFDVATDVVALHGGTIEKFIGDAVMAVWGTPIAHEDDAERAVRAGLELVSRVATLHPGLEARAGIMTGEAAVTIGATNQGMVAGDLVNTAARLQGVAEPGTVLVGEATMNAAVNAIVFERVGDTSLKGKTAPVPAWQALRVVAARGGQGRADALEPPFVGRDEELRQLKEHLHAVGRERRTRLVSITGIPGIGKSRLVWELEKYVDGITEDVWWHRGRSPSYGEGVTFWALGEMVRRRAGLTEDADEASTRERIAATVADFVHDVAERDSITVSLLALLGVEPAPGGRDVLFPAWRTFFERIADRGTTVLVFEDLQWADAGLLDFIDDMLAWSRNLPIVVITLSRPEFLDRRPDWGAGRRFTAMAVEPLTAEAMRDLLDGLVPGVPEPTLRAIVERADGVPLYAVETVRSLLSQGHLERVGEEYRVCGELTTLTVPESLRSLIASRLDALAAEDQALVRAASVLGQVFPAPTLAAVLGSDDDDVERRLHTLVRRELVELETDHASPERGQFKFMQSLIREVAYGTMGRRERRALHLAVARHYEATGDEEMSGALASHYLAAHEASEEGPEADAIGVQARLALSAAADRAVSLGAHAQAIRYLEQALSVTTETIERAPLLDRAARSAAAAATADARQYARAAVDAYREIGNVPAALGATARLGQVLLDATETTQAIDVLEAAIPEAEALDDPTALAETLARLARGYMRVGATDKAVAAADRALAIAEELDLDAVAAEALVNKGSALRIMGRRREPVALIGAALALAQKVGDRLMEVRIRNNYAVVLSTDDPERSVEILREALDLARDIGDRAMYVWVAGTVAQDLFRMGRDWDEHLPVLRDALETATLRHDRLRMREHIAWFEAVRGENLDTVVAEIRAIAGDSTVPDDLQAVLAIEAYVASISGRHDDAYRHALARLEVPNQSPHGSVGLALEMAIAGGDRSRIAESARRALELPAGEPAARALVAEARGALAAIEGRTADAVAAFGEAHAILTELRQRFMVARLALRAAQLLPDDPVVRQMVAAARPVLEELRARPYLDSLDAALAPAPATSAAPVNRAETPAAQPS